MVLEETQSSLDFNENNVQATLKNIFVLSYYHYGKYYKINLFMSHKKQRSFY